MKQNPFSPKLESCFIRLCGLILWAGALVATGVLILSAPRGLEGTDEASYLLTAANPWASPGNGILSGFFLHPLWLLTGHVGPFRIAGVVILILASLVFSLSLIRAGPQLGVGDAFSKYRLLLVPSLAIAVLTRYSVGNRTPGYDWAILLCGLLLAAFWLNLESWGKRPASVGWLAGFTFVALGIFIAKWMVFPGVMILFLALMFFKFRGFGFARLVWFIVVWSFLWAFVWLLYVTPGQVEATVRAAYAQLGTGSHDSILRHYGIGFLKGSWQVIRALPWIFILYLMVWSVLWMFQRSAPSASKVAGISFLAGLGLAAARGYFYGGLTTFSKGMMIALVWLTGVFFITRAFRKLLSSEPGTQAASLRTLTLFMLLPLLNGAGTATGITDYLGHGVVFFAAAGWILLGQATARGLPAWTLAAAVLCLGVIQAARSGTATLNTYRVGSVWVPNLVPLTVGPEKGRLWTYPLMANCLQAIHEEISRHGYQEGDPILGITDCPGLVYLLGGVSPGACWFISYYLPENPGVKLNIENIPEKNLARCWAIVRSSARQNEALEKVWPEKKGVAIPVLLGGEFFWPWGDREGEPERIFLYRPASLPDRR